MFGRNRSQELFNQGTQLLDSRDYDGAIEYLSKALKAARDDLERIPALHHRGMAYVEKIEDMVSNLDGEDDKIRDVINNNMQLAVEDFSEAITNAKIYASNRSDIISDLYVCLSRAHYWLGQPQDVIADSNNALKYNSQNAEAYLARGFVYLEVVGDPSPAIDDFTKAIKIQPSAKGYTYRAWGYLDQENESDARDDYLRAVRLEPEARTSQRTSSLVNYYGWEDFKKRYDREAG